MNEQLTGIQHQNNVELLFDIYKYEEARRATASAVIFLSNGQPQQTELVRERFFFGRR